MVIPAEDSARLHIPGRGQRVTSVPRTPRCPKVFGSISPAPHPGTFPPRGAVTFLDTFLVRCGGIPFHLCRSRHRFLEILLLSTCCGPPSSGEGTAPSVNIGRGGREEQGCGNANGCGSSGLSVAGAVYLRRSASVWATLGLKEKSNLDCA